MSTVLRNWNAWHFSISLGDLHGKVWAYLRTHTPRLQNLTDTLCQLYQGDYCKSHGNRCRNPQGSLGHIPYWLWTFSFPEANVALVNVLHPGGTIDTWEKFGVWGGWTAPNCYLSPVPIKLREVWDEVWGRAGAERWDVGKGNVGVHM